MTLFLRLLIAASILVSALAQADYIKPDRGGHHGGGNHYGPVVPDRGNDYGPILPYPDQGGYPDYGHSGRVVEQVYVGRYLRHESIDLMREIGHLYGYRVEQVRVVIQRSREVNSSVELLVNRRPEDSARADVGRDVVLNPRSLLEIGRHLNSLEVYARGEMLIERIEVVLLSENGQRPPPYDDGREIAVTLNLPSYFPPQPRLDLTPYVDTYRYRGYEIRGVEVTAFARYNTASLEIQMNGFREGSMHVTTRQSTQTVRSRQNLVIGSSFGSLVLVPRGDSNILQVRLILSRY